METSSAIIELLAVQFGAPRRKITLSARLFQDLHMDGDDAAEFFQEVERRYGTDLTALYERWSSHFGPEIAALDFALLLGLFVWAIASLFRSGGSAGSWRLFGLAVLLSVLDALARMWLLRGWPKTITVADVIAAVERGAWPRPE